MLRPLRWLLSVLTLTHLSIIGVTLAVGRAQPRGYELAFSSSRAGSADIFRLDLRHGVIAQVTHTPTRDEERPVWSPDGELLAYEIFDNFSRKIGIVRADGSDACALEPGSFRNEDPVWSPDGEHLAFNGLLPETGQRISVAAINLRPASGAAGEMGCTLTALVHSDNGSDRGDFGQQWSPDGRQIVFTSWRDGNPNLYVMDVASGDSRRLTDNLLSDHHPQWSPDGRQIAFMSDMRGNFDVYVVDSAGGEPRQLTTDGNYDSNPVWSPDGQTLVFVSDRTGKRDLYRINVDGTGLRRLTTKPNMEEDPVWSPDGRYIAYWGVVGSNVDLFIVSVEDGHVRRLTRQMGFDTTPAWRPQ